MDVLYPIDGNADIPLWQIREEEEDSVLSSDEEPVVTRSEAEQERNKAQELLKQEFSPLAHRDHFPHLKGLHICISNFPSFPYKKQQTGLREIVQTSFKHVFQSGFLLQVTSR